MRFLKIILLCCVSTPLFSQVTTATKNPSRTTLDSLKTQLEIIFMKDQTFRLIYKDAENKLGKDSKAMEYFWEVVEKQDKYLENEVVQIIEKYGWLGISQIGKLANTTLWGVLQHGSVASKEKYAPLLKESILKKESQPLHYARLIDRMLINSNRPQLYGTQIKFDTNKNGVFFPIKAPEYINQRREKLGLSTIQKFAKQKGIPWNITQKRS